MLDYKLVEAFAAVAQEGGFEKAAKALHLTQSAISQRVKLLEEHAGCVLLVRSSPPRPTDAGKEMLKHYRQVQRLEADLGPGLGQRDDGFTTLPVAVNADSLATWFLPAIDAYLEENAVLLDLTVDDQAQTHQLLRDGEVLGCISERSEPMQGCRVEYLGSQEYRLYATPSYQSKWFNNGMDLESAVQAPFLIFNRKDLLHETLLAQVLPELPPAYNAFYLPSSELFTPTIASGRVCGVSPQQQAQEYVDRGELVNLIPGHSHTVHLHWHCWNLESGELQRFTDALVDGAKRELAKFV